MAREQENIERKQYTCRWCGWVWYSSLKNKEPKVCAKCHVDWRKEKLKNEKNTN